MKMIQFSPPRIDEKVINEVVDTLKSGWITTGRKTKTFENKLSEYCDIKTVCCVSSASYGLEIMLKWFGVENGDEVILSAYTFGSTANAVVHCGASPVFVDINRDDFNISVEGIKRAVTSRTKVIMPVDFAGFPCDYREINQLVNKDNVKSLFKANNDVQKKLGRILVLADAAHSFGAEYYDNKAGSLTDVTVFSFHAVKNLTTAEGGAIVLNLPEPFDNELLYKQIGILSSNGREGVNVNNGSRNWKYDIVEAGFKGNMPDVLASIGLAEIERYEISMLAKRKYIFDVYSQAFSKKTWAIIPKYRTENKLSSCHIYPLRINNISEQQRDSVVEKIYKKGVSVNVHFIPVPMFTFYRRSGYDIGNYPVSYDNYSKEISLPVYYDLSDDQIRKIVEVVCSSVEEVI